MKNSTASLLLLVFTQLLILSACIKSKKHSRFAEYSATPSGLLYHRYNIGEGKNYPQNGDFLVLSLTLKKLDDSVLPFDLFKNEAGLDTFHYYEANTKFHFFEALSMLCVGDSCSFILSSKLFGDTSAYHGLSNVLKNDTLVKLEAKLINLITAKQEAADKKNYLKFCEELAKNEQIQLKQFFDTTKQNVAKKSDENGLYFNLLKKGNGKLAKSGDEVTIRYIGKFLNGHIFDNSTYVQGALNFTLGEPGQVVRGLELALYKMHEGDAALLVLPSNLAFGSKGSAGGIVSPFKTVTFALEILKIN
jgi:FKBP-type peptidyl-prolyl cis-trans isomerase